MLKKIWSRWKRFGQWMGDQIARVFLVLFYFTIALPFGLLVTLTQDPLDTRFRNRIGWVPRAPHEDNLEVARRSF